MVLRITPLEQTNPEVWVEVKHSPAPQERYLVRLFVGGRHQPKRDREAYLYSDACTFACGMAQSVARAIKLEQEG